MTFDNFFQNLGKRFPHVLRFLRDPIATPIITSPAPGACYPGMAGGAGADAVIPWDVSIPHLPGWDIEEKAFRFNADGSTTEIHTTWQYSPTRLVIAAAEHAVAAASDCADVMVVIYQVEESTSKRRVAGVVQFQICGNCTPPSPPPPPPPPFAG